MTCQLHIVPYPHQYGSRLKTSTSYDHLGYLIRHVTPAFAPDQLAGKEDKVCVCVCVGGGGGGAPERRRW